MVSMLEERGERRKNFIPFRFSSIYHIFRLCSTIVFTWDVYRLSLLCFNICLILCLIAATRVLYTVMFKMSTFPWNMVETSQWTEKILGWKGRNTQIQAMQLLKRRSPWGAYQPWQSVLQQWKCSGLGSRMQFIQSWSTSNGESWMLKNGACNSG